MEIFLTHFKSVFVTGVCFKPFNTDHVAPEHRYADLEKYVSHRDVVIHEYRNLSVLQHHVEIICVFASTQHGVSELTQSRFNHVTPV